MTWSGIVNLGFQEAGLHLDQQTIAVALRHVAGEEWRP